MQIHCYPNQIPWLLRPKLDLTYGLDLNNNYKHKDYLTNL